MQRTYRASGFPVILAVAATAGGITAAPSGAARPAPPSQHQVIGDGTPASCTSAAVVRAVARGGTITFRCGRRHVTITMTATARVANTSHRVVLDGGGRVTLRGNGRQRLLYLDTCDPERQLTTRDCRDQQWPQLVVQNIVLADGDAPARPPSGAGAGGGGAIFDLGGRLTVTGSVLTGNRCSAAARGAGGGAVLALAQWHGLPARITDDVFRDGSCGSGGALGSTGVSWQVASAVFTGNTATGGSGGAIYAAGSQALTVLDSVFRGNQARTGGGAIFFGGDGAAGTLTLRGSVLFGNPSGGSRADSYPGISFHGRGAPAVSDSVIW